jgi:hypothetical protein
MNKDVIYIDVEDDITAIIGKVKDAKEKIVAIVPPKRIGILQSAVNLRLIARAATQSSKHLVIISNNSALMSLAAAAKIPVAKNLQSKPEIAEIAALDIDDGEDIIDGNNLPIGELAKTADSTAATDTTGSAIEAALRADAANGAPRATPPAPGQAPVKPKVKSGIKVPNFNSFRKKLIFLIGGGVFLVGFLIWAVFFAPHATVIITARTSDTSANAKVSLAQAASTSLSANTIKATVQQLKKDVSVDFDATGTKEVGEKATGTMKLTRTSVSNKQIDVPAGTSFTSGARTFVSTEAAVLGPTTVGENGNVFDTATVGVVATSLGDEYNLSARDYQSNIGGFTARGSDMAGGSKKQIKVVSAGDVQDAAEKLAQQNADAAKSQLKGQFDTSVTVVDQTFKADTGTKTSVPAVDQEATSGKGKLTATITYTMTGVPQTEYTKYLDDYFKKQIESKADQRVYDNGAKKITFTNVTATEGGFTANIVAAAKIGPKIDDAAIKDLAKGKRYGEIQSSIEAIQGVDNVDVKFWPFWVSSAPSDASKISVEFNLNESK